MSLKKLIKNIKQLSKKQISLDYLQKDEVEALIEEKIIDLVENLKFPKINNVMETIKELSISDVSIVRFGDGELQLMNGIDIPFQKASVKLANRLKEVLSSHNQNLLVGIPSFIYQSKNHLNDIPRNFWTLNGKKFRDTIKKFINPDNTYYAAEFTIAADAYKNFDKENYFSCLRQIWQGKNVIWIAGSNAIDKIEYNIFDNAASLEYLPCPSVNAFDDYDNILTQCKKIDKSGGGVLAISLGPTAKILAYDLALAGYRALDLGHVAKSYDWFMKGRTTLNMKDAIEFFGAD